ncbi:unnamed protein product [marine sediment metagenome]|uniref:DNA methylase N-4/N-6 domain-containing protein n=1 Tax=marine sediment metagenome TaxID=412755 RepID=X0T644_9ZZZZ
MIKFVYLTQPPKKYTFEQPKLKLWTEQNCRGRVLNLFAGKTRLAVNEYRIDLSAEFNPDHIGEAYEFVKNTDMIFDTIVFDPPYNLRKSREKYEGRYIGSLTKIKNIIGRLLTPSGRIIHYGYDSVGMSNSRGFKKIEVCLVCHGGDHNDTICLVEQKYTNDIFNNNTEN